MNGQRTDADIIASYEQEIREVTPCNWELFVPEDPCLQRAVWLIRMRRMCMGAMPMFPQLAGMTVYACEEHMTRLLSARRSPSQVFRCTLCGHVAPLSHLAYAWERIAHV